jgi:hypothetical protein
VLYVRDDRSTIYSIPPTAPDDRWCFRFVLRPTDPRCVAWQAHGYANVDGIDGSVDLDMGFAALFRPRE